MAQEQFIYQPNTSSKTGTFYFAFGSNLSAYQMSIRLTHSTSSSVPVAVARLDGHAWIICERGYANVVALPESNAATDANTVWGIVYNMSPEDEATLDRYEGHNDGRNPEPQLNPDPETQHIKPYLQGDWDYNKHYLPLTVTRWLTDPNDYGISVPGWSPDPLSPSGSDNTTIRALVYVDEHRTGPGEINLEYIGRMNRAIAESVQLGLPQSWVDNIMRKFVPPDIHVNEEGYVGTDEGYVEAEATETGDHVKEKTARQMN
ncbi:hypothetical protein LTR67_009505 [Exophiala xenobiotica]